VRLRIFPDRHTAVAAAAERIATVIKAAPASVIGLATGRTPLAIYDDLARRVAAGSLSFRDCVTFNLDEYAGLSSDDPHSFGAYMNRHLFSRVDIDTSRAHIPRGDAPDVDAEIARYEAAIRGAGGINLQLLGIGENGHIGFNEPPSSLASRTRLVTLTQETRRANSADFPDLGAVPRQAITMGIANILEAKEILLVALGGAKTQAAAAMIEGEVSPACPASALQLHPAVTVILDAAAADGLAHASAADARHD
jgi:glucosamine-6-phosphate deaminase